MLVLLAFIILFHLASAVLLFIATINNAWWTTANSTADIWQICTTDNETITRCGGFTSAYEGYIQAIQATMIVSTILCCIAFLTFILQLFRLKQGERFVFSAIIQLLSSLSVMVAASIYTDQAPNFHKDSLQNGNYGYAFILAWIAFAFTLLSGVMYLILRKRK